MLTILRWHVQFPAATIQGYEPEDISTIAGPCDLGCKTIYIKKAIYKYKKSSPNCKYDTYSALKEIINGHSRIK